MQQTSPTILLCTLGASWAVIPEIAGWLAPSVVDLYAQHPARAELDRLRQQHGLRAPDELWICTTEGRQTRDSLNLLVAWWEQLGRPLPLRIWTASGTDQLASQGECLHLRELILRATLHASEAAGERGQLLVSLAGGRKTMSADMQEAAALFGARAWLHVVGPDPLPDVLRQATSELLSRPLDAAIADRVSPLIAGIGTRSELLDVPLDGSTVTGSRFPLPLARPGIPESWPLPPQGATLHEELGHRQREGGRLLGGYVSGLTQTERYATWRSLYRLAPRQIEHLKSTRLGPQHRDLLVCLPKADLHRHVGGSLDLAAQRAVAAAIWTAATPAKRASAQSLVSQLLSGPEPWDWNWPDRLSGEARAIHHAALHLHAAPGLLERQLFAVTEPRVALAKTHRHGFAAYERPGEMTGSAQLSHPAALESYARALVDQVRAEGLLYLELRGSPHKYRPADAQGFLRDFDAALRAAGAQTRAFDPDDAPAPRIAFIWIVDRRQRESAGDIVRQAVEAREHLSGFLLGLDLAGAEGTKNPEALALDFAPAFRECMPITIHAGEGEAAENIWQAAYHLHADRIGHGLSLVDNARLMQRFRDRRIALELCPTSNREVVGFHDPGFPDSAVWPPYPLAAMMHAGLPLSLCTDNPGISRTTLADEYLTASRMIENGLSLWDALALIHQGFEVAMAPAAEREALLKSCERAVLEAVAHHLRSDA